MAKNTTAPLSAAVGKMLCQRKKSVSVAESCTGGLLASIITDTPGSSQCFRGGIVLYDTRLKSRLAGIPAVRIRQHDVVSRYIAEKLALYSKALFKSDYGVGITGNAGPDRGDSKKPVGTVWIAVAGPRQITAKPCRFSGSRGRIKLRAALEALRLLRLSLKSR